MLALIGIAFVGGYIYSVYVCFTKGKKVFGWLGVGAIVWPFAPVLVWFPLVGSLRSAKPDSTWATKYGNAPPSPQVIAGTYESESPASAPAGKASMVKPKP